AAPKHLPTPTSLFAYRSRKQASATPHRAARSLVVRRATPTHFRFDFAAARFWEHRVPSIAAPKRAPLAPRSHGVVWQAPPPVRRQALRSKTSARSLSPATASAPAAVPPPAARAGR